eukprot:TRINITY_DN6060_c0_g1_i4.p1 TRINITY_DN6060_c0_g1~~TRINITY_DN6060_c0_g1_i4.p1  ORF type:complete len:373 (+),score=29.74 TRINITY_DN6060_c0_g1_i4:161-1279(+)
MKMSLELFLYFCIICNIGAPFALDFLLKTRFEHYGKVEDICASIDDLRESNNQQIDALSQLSNTTFFKIFRVNLNAECPIWAKQSICTSKSRCESCVCDEAEVPVKWRDEYKLKNISSPVVIDREFVREWKDNGKKLDQFYVEEDENKEGVYVNLKLNAESYTGYQGQSIWGHIYRENIFKGALEDLSLEERTLNRMISGLHTSISIHVSWFFRNNQASEKRPNFKLFFEKVGNYPSRIENLYFLYSILLRAFNRASHVIQNYDYETGDLKSDIATNEIINRLIQLRNPECQNPFREDELFNDVTKDSVKQQFMTYVQNISRIMNCEECQICKVNGKLQIYGIGTALSILCLRKSRDSVKNLLSAERERQHY